MEDPVDGDGCVAKLFPVLAQKFKRPGAPMAQPFCQCRVVPTVTYAYQTKAHWYYTKHDEPGRMELRTKLKADLSNANIIEGFLADDMMLRGHTPRSEIIAVYIRSFQDREKPGTATTMFDYMDVDALKAFLYAPPHAKQNNGIIQRFVESQGEHNAVIRVTWTPRHVKVVRRISRQPLKKGHVAKMNGVYRRVATFEGPETLSRETKLTGVFPRKQVRLHADGSSSDDLNSVCTDSYGPHTTGDRVHRGHRTPFTGGGTHQTDCGWD